MVAPEMTRSDMARVDRTGWGRRSRCLLMLR
jgi:hypothetical protein